jgi:hypothetical protein
VARCYAGRLVKPPLSVAPVNFGEGRKGRGERRRKLWV